jgi:chromosome segregation ATPase
LADHTKDLRRELSDRDQKFELQKQTIVTLERDIHHISNNLNNEKDTVFRIEKTINDKESVIQQIQQEYVINTIQLIVSNIIID